MKISATGAVGFQTPAMPRWNGRSWSAKNYKICVWRNFRKEILLHWISGLEILKLIGSWFSGHQMRKIIPKSYTNCYRNTSSQDAGCHWRSTAYTRTSISFFKTYELLVRKTVMGFYQYMEQNGATVSRSSGIRLGYVIIANFSLRKIKLTVKESCDFKIMERSIF